MQPNQNSVVDFITEAIQSAEAVAPKGEVLASMPMQLQDIEAWISVPQTWRGGAPTLTVTHSSMQWGLITLVDGDLLIVDLNDGSSQAVYSPRLIAELMTSPRTKRASYYGVLPSGQVAAL